MERKVKAKRLSVIVGLAFAAIASAIIALVGFTAERSYAAKDFDYHVVVDSSGNFAGINSRNNSNGAVAVSGKEQPANKTPNAPIISFEFANGGIDISAIDGLFCQMEIGAGGSQFAWFYVQSSDGVLYRVKIDGATAYNSNKTAVNVKGTATTGYNFTLPINEFTIYFPKTSIVSSGKVIPGSAATAPSANAAISDGTIITALHYVIRSNSSPAALNPARPITVSTIGGVKINADNPEESEVSRSFESPSLVSTADSSATADINFGDMKKGDKVYAKYCLTPGGSFITTGTEHEFLQYTRNNVNLSVKYTDDNGKAITEPQSGSSTVVRSLSFDAEKGGFAYDISDLYRDISGYAKPDDAVLTDTVYCEKEITLVYRPLTRIKSVSAALQDRIEMRFNVEIADEVKEIATVSINEKTDMKAADGVDNGDGSYCFVYKINAAEMTKNINIKVENGTETGEEKNYSFREYADELLNDETSSDSLKNLIKATLNYGACAQIYFGVNADDLANSVLEESDKTVDVESIGNAVKSITGELPPEVETVRFSLSCKDSIVFNFYLLAAADSDLSAVTLKINGQEFIPEEAGNGWYSKSTELAPAELSDEITFTVGDSLITVNAYAYFESCLNSTDGDLVNLVKAMYNYAEYAKSHFNKG